MSVGPFLVPSKTLTFFVFKKRSSGIFRLLCQCWLLSTNINIIKRTNAYSMYTNSTKTNIIKQSIPYYCIQEKFESARVDTPGDLQMLLLLCRFFDATHATTTSSKNYQHIHFNRFPTILSCFKH